mmetsp:Transcript_26475/g.26920  ORF Transcript_26475/g.26920 Transcript_26475/m.26920 type:complete len:172 (+) Transcript_26475:157-672(+)
MPTAATQPSDNHERTPFSVAFATNDLVDPVPVMMVKKKGSDQLSSRTAIAVTAMLSLAGITTATFTFHHNGTTTISSSSTISIEKDVFTGTEKCTVATGTYDHTDKSVLCYQYGNEVKYCWSKSTHPNEYLCTPSGYCWNIVSWYYVNPHNTCGEPCTEFDPFDADSSAYR